MIPRWVISLVVFWAMQVFASVAFKYGSKTGAHDRRWYAGFIGGNVVGATSVLLMMEVYGAMKDNPNLAAVLVTSGAFIGSQIALALIFRSRLAVRQWAGIVLVAVGTAAAAWGG